MGSGKILPQCSTHYPEGGDGGQAKLNEYWVSIAKKHGVV